MFQDFTQQPNVGGLRRVVLLPDDQMAANGQIVAEPTVLELRFPTTRGSLNITDNGMTAFGKLYTSTATLTLPSTLTDIQAFLTANQYRRYILYIQDANDRIHRIGGSGDGATVNLSYSIDPSIAATQLTMSHTGPIGLPFGAGGLVGIADGPGIIEGYTIEEILANSSATVIEQLSMINLPNPWAATNLAVSTISEGHLLSHSLGSTKVAVRFFDTNGSENFEIRSEVLDANTIKIYLPTPDGGSSSWSGEVFIIKRN